MSFNLFCCLCHLNDRFDKQINKGKSKASLLIIKFTTVLYNSLCLCVHQHVGILVSLLCIRGGDVGLKPSHYKYQCTM